MNTKTLLLNAEQGWGDQIMFARYAAPIKKLYPSCRILYRCDPPMHRLFGGVFGLDGVVDSTKPFEDFDFHIPIMTVPHVLGTTLDNIPEAHCIRPMPDWPAWKLSNVNILRKRVGIVWAGSPMHGRDKARSIEPEILQPMIDAHPECDFYSIQAGPKQPEVARLRNVHDLAPQITNWTDTAQMLACMNVLVTVDTAVAHLAGAVGTPVMMLTPHSPDFRWMLGRTDSPWYRKLTLFRQEKAGEWADVIAAITKAL